MPSSNTIQLPSPGFLQSRHHYCFGLFLLICALGRGGDSAAALRLVTRTSRVGTTRQIVWQGRRLNFVTERRGVYATIIVASGVIILFFALLLFAFVFSSCSFPLFTPLSLACVASSVQQLRISCCSSSAGTSCGLLTFLCHSWSVSFRYQFLYYLSFVFFLSCLTYRRAVFSLSHSLTTEFVNLSRTKNQDEHWVYY